jgi:phosphate:Na+ symporter
LHRASFFYAPSADTAPNFAITTAPQLNNIPFWPVLAGLGLFLFGMQMLESALHALSGRAFKLFLRRQTGNTFRAILSGALATAVLQSSSMVSLLVMSLAGAGVLGLKNGIGMIMGANVGTTATGWLITLLGFRFSIELIIAPLLAAGGLLAILGKSEKLRRYSKLIMGFALLFLGLGMMKDGMAGAAAAIQPEWLRGHSMAWFLGFGVLFAAIVHSSSAAMTLSLASLAAGIISLEQAAFITIGSELGTTITALTGTLRANEIRRKVGWSQFYFNLISAVLAIATMGLIFGLMPAGMDPLIRLVTFQTTINVLGIALVAPLLNPFTAFIHRMVPGGQTQLAQYIVQIDPGDTENALEALQSETRRFIQQAIHVNRLQLGLERDPETDPADAYSDLKNYESEISTYYVRMQQPSITRPEADDINRCITGIRNAALSAKDLKDERHTVLDLSNAVSEAMHGWYKELKYTQVQFYAESTGFLQTAESIALPTALNTTAHTGKIYQLFSEGNISEIGLSSLLNLVRGIGKSNDALLRALEAQHALAGE